jgi:hypothetical protein
MRSLNQSSRHSFLKAAVTALLAAVLIGWLAADPREALNFWPGVLIGTLASILGWRRWRVRRPWRAARYFKFFSIVLFVWFSLVFVPQRDIPVVAAPFGIWLALTVALTLEQIRWKRSLGSEPF